MGRYTALSFMYKDISYRRLHAAIRHFAATLVALGVKAGDVVTLCLPNVPAAVTAMYGISYIGATASILHPLTPPEAVLETMRGTDSRMLLYFDKLFPKQMDILGKSDICVVLLSAGEYFSALERAIIQRINKVDNRALKAFDGCSKVKLVRYDSRTSVAPVAAHPGKNEDVCILLHSGGTTGVPKTIPITNRMFNAESHTVVHLCQPPVLGKSGMLMVLPIFHGFGVGVCLHAMLPYGFRAVLQPAFSAEKTVRIIKRKPVTMLTGVPTMFEKMLATGKFRGRGIKKLQNAYCGGDMMPTALKERFDKACSDAGSPCKLYQGYGLTETVAVCCANSPFYEDRTDCIGKPSFGVQMRIAGEDDATMPIGQKGEICVAGDTVMSGYLDGTPEGVLREYEGKLWLHTGDCGFEDADGYFHFVGRIKRMSIIAGVNVYHQEIERLATLFEGVSAAAVCEVRRNGKPAVKLFVVSPKGEAIIEPLRQYLSARLTKYCVPREIAVIDNMPLTPMGKSDYKALAAGETND